MGSVELVRQQTEVSRLLSVEIANGESLLQDFAKVDGSTLDEFRERYLDWYAQVVAVLDASFKTSGVLTPSPKDDFASTLDLADLHWGRAAWTTDRAPAVLDDVRDKVRKLKGLQGRLALYSPSPPSQAKSLPSSDAPIFLVHGRDTERREIVRRFLERSTQREVIILADRPNRGSDLLGKLLSNSQEASFAVVLLTPDDVGGLEDEKPTPRARQNVIFELGLFIATLGRDRVAALYEPSVELPTDFSGVAYISLANDTWQLGLVRELLAAQIDASIDRTL